MASSTAPPSFGNGCPRPPAYEDAAAKPTPIRVMSAYQPKTTASEVERFSMPTQAKPMPVRISTQMVNTSTAEPIRYNSGCSLTSISAAKLLARGFSKLHTSGEGLAYIETVAITPLMIPGRCAYLAPDIYCCEVLSCPMPTSKVNN